MPSTRRCLPALPTLPHPLPLPPPPPPAPAQPADDANWFLRYLPRTCRPQHEIFVTYIAPPHYNAIRWGRGPGAGAESSTSQRLVCSCPPSRFCHILAAAPPTQTTTHTPCLPACRRQHTGDRLRRSFGRQHSQLARAVSSYTKAYGLPDNPQHVVAAGLAS